MSAYALWMAGVVGIVLSCMALSFCYCCVCRALPQTLVLDHVSPATRLLEKRRQMFEVQEALEAQKQDFNRKVSQYM